MVRVSPELPPKFSQISANHRFTFVNPQQLQGSEGIQARGVRWMA